MLRFNIGFCLRLVDIKMNLCYQLNYDEIT